MYYILNIKGLQAAAKICVHHNVMARNRNTKNLEIVILESRLKIVDYLIAGLRIIQIIQVSTVI